MPCWRSSGRSSRSTCPTRRPAKPSARSTSCTTSPSRRSWGRALVAITWRSTPSRRVPEANMPDRIEETAELRRLRKRIDALDRRLVELLKERAALAREAGRAKTGAGRRAIRDAEREREVLLRVSMANTGPLPQADLVALYRRLFVATRALEARDRLSDLTATDPADGA